MKPVNPDDRGFLVIVLLVLTVGMAVAHAAVEVAADNGWVMGALLFGVALLVARAVVRWTNG